MTLHRLALVVPALLLAFAPACGGKQRLAGPDFPSSGAPYVRPSQANDPRALDPEDLRHRVILIGDTGDPREREPSLEELGVWGDVAAEKTTVLFLGDNLYFSGLEDDDRPRGEQVLRQQLTATQARKIFVPGNHDWGGLNPTRAEVLHNQEEFIDREGQGRARFLPKGGCPGPNVVELAPGASTGGGAVIAVLLDTQWWWVPAEKRRNCPGGNDADQVVAALDRVLTEHKEDLVIVASHHPFTSGSSHGGMSRGFAQDVVEDLLIGMGFHLQDLSDPQYVELINAVSEPMKKNKPLVYAAGHDHALQILDGGEIAELQVVSGAGSENKVAPVTNIPSTIFAHARTGFVVVDVLGGPPLSRVMVRVIEPGRWNPVFEIEIPER